MCYHHPPPLPRSAPHILFSAPHLDGIRASTTLKWHPYIVLLSIRSFLELVIPYPVPALKIILILITTTICILSYLCSYTYRSSLENKYGFIRSLHNYWISVNQICAFALSFLKEIPRKRIPLFGKLQLQTISILQIDTWTFFP